MRHNPAGVLLRLELGMTILIALGACTAGRAAGPGSINAACLEQLKRDGPPKWTEVAKQRRTFATALGSVVEHLHPIWGKGDDDPVYRKGQKFSAEDGKLFRARLKEHTTKKPLVLP